MLAIALALLLQGRPLIADGGQPRPSDDVPDRASTVTQPDWQRRPSGEDLMRLYPPSAVSRGVSGRATMSCEVTAEGTLAGCRVMEQSPPGEGFGEAALRMAPLFKMRPMTKNGVPVSGGTVRIPIQFAIPGRSLDPLTTAFTCYGYVAELVDREPGNAAAWGAARAWTHEAMRQEAAVGGNLTALEMGLANAHRVADAQKDASYKAQTLKRCLDAVARAEGQQK